MAYGSKIDSDGKTIGAGGFSSVMTGQRVTGNVLKSFDFYKDKEGVVQHNKAQIIFMQQNGATFSTIFMDSSEGWAIDIINSHIKHICTKIVTEAEYDTIVSETSDFATFITTIRDNIINKGIGKSFACKIILKKNNNNGKWYPCFPKYPNFIEVDGQNPSTLKKTDPRYDIYEIPEESKPTETVVNTESKGNSTDDLPF